MATTLKYTLVKIRKPHYCDACLRKFKVNTQMFYFFVVDNGDSNTGYVCDTCDKILKHFQKHDNCFEWEHGEIDNCLDKGQTPEDYLNELTKK